jgi:hypothetical protein
MSYAAARSEIDIDEFERRLRGPAQRATGDPLAELARLVSGGADSKPEALDAMFARPVAAAPAPQVEPAGWVEDAPDLMDELRGPLPETFASEAYAPETHAPQSFAPSVSAFEASHEDPFQSEARPDWAMPVAPQPVVSQAPRSRLPLYATAAVIAVGLVGIGTTFAMRGRTVNPGELVEVKATPGPTKVAAQATADAGVPASESTVLDRAAPSQTVKRVVTRQEAPVDLSDAAARPSRVISMSGDPSPSRDAIAGIVAEPRKVKTVAVRPDGTIIGAPVVAAAPPADFTPTASPPPARTATPKSGNRVAATTPAPVVDKPAPVAAKPAPVTPKPLPPKVAAKPQPTKVAATDEASDDADAKPVASAGGGFAVQLAAPGTEAEARAVASRLASKYSDALDGARLTFRKAADKDVYRVRAGGLSREAAVATCEKIKAAGGPCFVAKN